MSPLGRWSTRQVGPRLCPSLHPLASFRPRPQGGKRREGSAVGLPHMASCWPGLRGREGQGGCMPGSWRSRTAQVWRPKEGMQAVLQFLPADISAELGESVQRPRQVGRHPGWLVWSLLRLPPAERPIIPAQGAAVALYPPATAVKPPGRGWMEVASGLALWAPLECSPALWQPGTFADKASSRHLQVLLV